MSLVVEGSTIYNWRIDYLFQEKSQMWAQTEREVQELILEMTALVRKQLVQIGGVRDSLIRLCPTFLFFIPTPWDACAAAYSSLPVSRGSWRSDTTLLTVGSRACACASSEKNRREGEGEWEGEGERRVSICTSKASKLRSCLPRKQGGRGREY